MLSFHKKLIELRNDFGYSYDNTGACLLYSEKGIDAWLAGDDEFQRFEERKKLIEAENNLATRAQRVRAMVKRKASLRRPNLQSLGEENHKIQDLEAFIEQGELYLNPSHYFQLFDSEVDQYQQMSIARFAQSKALEHQGGRFLHTRYAGLYSESELVDYVKLYAEYAKQFNLRFALSLFTDDHGFALCYDEKNASFLVLDVNQPYLQPIPMYHDGKINEESCRKIASQLMAASMNVNVTAFVTTVYTTGNNAQQGKSLTKKLMQDERYLALHKITPSKASIVLPNGSTLLWLAVSYDDINTVQKILDQQWPNGEFAANVNVMANGDTPILVAVTFNYDAMVTLLLNAKTVSGDSRVTLECRDRDGNTPVVVAIQNGNSNILKLLAVYGANMPINDLLSITQNKLMREVLLAWRQCQGYMQRLDHSLFDVADPYALNYELLKIYVETLKAEILTTFLDDHAGLNQADFESRIAAFEKQIEGQSHKRKSITGLLNFWYMPAREDNDEQPTLKKLRR